LFGNKLEDEEKVPFKACSGILVPFFKDVVHRNVVGAAAAGPSLPLHFLWCPFSYTFSC